MTDPYLHESDEVLRDLGTGREQGLTGEDARKRLDTIGPNELEEREGRSIAAMLLAQLREVLVLILIVAAGASFFMHEVLDGSVILIIVVLNTALSFWQEFKAEKAMAALKSMAVPEVRVRRDGEEQTVSAREIVPGDIVLVEAGNIAPADARLLAAANLRVEESALTGESEPVLKHDGPLSAEAPLAERGNMLYMGTVISYGRGEAVVTATGMDTELGNIAAMLHEVEDERTPLQERLAHLGGVLAAAALALILVVAGLVWFRGAGVRETFMTAISMAVAAIPEGLPAVVTIALALGAKTMLRRKALIRNLPAVETLGSVTVICTDKTGTLTQNRMTVATVVRGDEQWSMDEVARRVAEDEEVRLLLAAGSLCSDASIVPAGNAGGSSEVRVLGDPTEAALVMAAAEAGLSRESLRTRFPREAEVPFDSERKRMTTVHRLDQGAPSGEGTVPVVLPNDLGGAFIAFTKGAVDSLLNVCTHRLQDGERRELNDTAREGILEANNRLAGRGYRVLAVACRSLAEVPAEGGPGLERDLVYLGMVGMIDPVRPEAIPAVRSCRDAGIRVVMITGDHPLTASAIADELGLKTDGEAMTGSDLEGHSAEDIRERIRDVSVFARVSPEHKMAIVDGLQANGEVVSMTGDGVNDAPALKSADIGVSMGIMGTDVARESSDMVLLDDNFATIVGAVKQGRTIYDNIRKFVTYILTGNAGEIIVMLLGPLVGMPIPLLPIQILWINLVTDGVPAVALGYEEAEDDVMGRPPFRPEEGVFSRGVGLQIAVMGVLIGILSGLVGYVAWRLAPERLEWQTMVFTTLTFCQMVYALCIRKKNRSLFAASIVGNPALAGAVALTLLLQVAIIYTPWLNRVFETRALSAMQFSWCLIASAVVIGASELWKLARRRGAFSGAG